MLEVLDKAERITATESGRCEIKAPAKLNLGLRIYPARADGFHDLESWMVPLSWHDTVRYSPSTSLEMSVTGRAAGIPTGVEENLVGRAALRLARAAGITAHGRIELHKVVPAGGGLGGGSSDAASALVLLNHAWDLRLELAQLLKIAAELGSDVPLFVQGQPSLCRGRGEQLTTLRASEPLYATLLVPPMGLATKAVYGAFDAGHRHAQPTEFAWEAWAAMSADRLNELLVNDLEPAAFSLAPWLRELRDEAAVAVGQKVHMTGSGSTLYTLSSTAPRAADLADRLERELAGRVACVTARVVR